MDGGECRGWRVVLLIHSFDSGRLSFEYFRCRTETVHVRPEDVRSLFAQAQLDDRSCTARIELGFNDTFVGVNMLE